MTSANERVYLRNGLISLTLIACAFLLWVAVQSFKPPDHAFSNRIREIDISALKPGQVLTTDWEGHTVFVLRRTEKQIAWLKTYRQSKSADPIKDDLPLDELRNVFRSVNPEYLVVSVWKNGNDLVLKENERLHYVCDEFVYKNDELRVSQNITFPGGFYCANMGGYRISELVDKPFVYDPAGRASIDWIAPLPVPPHKMEGNKIVLYPKI